MRRAVFSILVDNSSGVLSRVAGLFSRRGYNIDSLTVGETLDPKLSRMTITVTGDDSSSLLTNGDTCYAYSFGVTIVENNQEIYTNCQKFDDEFVEYNQVMGELKAALDAVSYCVQQGYKKMYVIHDYEGVAFYATGAWVNEDERLENLYVKQMKEYEKQIEITFVKVKSHVANKTKINRYNDRADELANLALGR